MSADIIARGMAKKNSEELADIAKEYEPIDTTFNADGTITEVNSATGITKTTTFNADGTITEAFTGSITKTKTITFNADGSISEEVV